MLARVITAAVGIPIYLGFCLWGSRPFAVAVTVIAALGLAELMKAFWASGHRPNPILAALGLLSPIFVQCTAPWEIFGGYNAQKVFLVTTVGGLLLGIVWETIRAGRTREMRAARNIAEGLLCGSYIALFGGLVWLRKDSDSLGTGHFPNIDWGAGAVLLITFCVWANDTAAYFVGRKLGRHKLAPCLSPGKTVEGAIGGLLGSLIVGGVFGQIVKDFSFVGPCLGMITGVAAPLGDLFESAIKRELGVKDFGSIMPGHGGVLDRFDSLIFVSSLATLLLSWLRPNNMM